MPGTYDLYRSARAFLLVVICAFLLLVSPATLSAAMSPGQKIVAGEREMTITTYRLPVEVTVSNLDSETWFKDLEVEVKNNFKKPIYLLEFDLAFPEVPHAGKLGYGYPLIYGRIELLRRGYKADASDEPIPPGGSRVLKTIEPYWKGLGIVLSRARMTPDDVKKFWLTLTHISFGDGTGYFRQLPFKDNSISSSR